MSENSSPFSEITPLQAGDSATLAERITMKMKFDRNPLLKVLADKIAVRGYIGDNIGPQYLPRGYQYAAHLTEFDPRRIPRNVAIKPNHASGWGALFWDKAPIENNLSTWTPGDPSTNLKVLLLHPDATNPNTFYRLTEEWMASRYLGGQGGLEWAYHEIPPMLLAEELLITSRNELPHEYRLWMFGGELGFFQIQSPMHIRPRQSIYFYPNWQPIPIKKVDSRAIEFEKIPLRPPLFTKAVELAKVLSAPVDFVRVDCYIFDDRIVIGELTNYPNGGMISFEPEIYNYQLAELWPGVHP